MLNKRLGNKANSICSLYVIPKHTSVNDWQPGWSIASENRRVVALRFKNQKLQTLWLCLIYSKCLNLLQEHLMSVIWLYLPSPSGAVGHTHVEEVEVSWGAGQAVFRRAARAAGAHLVTWRTEAQLGPIGLLSGAVSTCRTLTHTGAVCGQTQIHTKKHTHTHTHTHTLQCHKNVTLAGSGVQMEVTLVKGIYFEGI